MMKVSSRFHTQGYPQDTRVRQTCLRGTGSDIGVELASRIYELVFLIRGFPRSPSKINARRVLRFWKLGLFLINWCGSL